MRRYLDLPRSSRARRRADVDAELRFHLEMRERELVAQGETEARARALAIQEFGDIEHTRRYCLSEDDMAKRVEHRSNLLAEFRQDVLHAWRTMRRAPGFAAVALATLALGIGANTAIYSVVQAVLVRQLPFAEPDRLVRIYGVHTAQPDEQGQISPGDFLDYRARQRTFTSLGAFRWSGGTYIGPGDPVALSGVDVDGSVFQTLGARALLGRTIQAGDDSAGSPPVVVLSFGVWQRLFGGDSAIVGKSINLSTHQYTVIGVMPPRFFFPTMQGSEIFLPLDLTPTLRDVNRARKFHFLGAVGRLRPAVSLASAAADLTAIGAQIGREHPESSEGMSLHPVAVREAVIGRTKPAILVLFGASWLVLLIACANVAGMLLSRAVSRRQELAVRTALGAGRPRLMRQMVTESVVLALCGGLLGIALAAWLTHALSPVASSAYGFGSLAGQFLGGNANVTIDRRVLLTTLALTIGCGVAFGLVPALAVSRDIHGTIRETGRGAGGGRHGLRAVLVTGQLSIAVMLLVGAGLLVRSLLHLQELDLGYSTAHALTFEVNLAGPRYNTRVAQDQFFDAFHARLRALPGVISTGSTGVLPLHGGSSSSLAIEGRDVAEGKLPEVGYVPVSDDYFRTLEIPLVRGRAFAATDRNDTPPVVILSEGLVRKFWPGGDPIGARVRLGPNPADPWSTVVGIVGDVRQGAFGDPRPTAYVSSRQDHWGGAAFIVRTTVDPMSLVPAVRRELRALDPTLPLTDPASMDQVHSGVLSFRRFPMQLMSAFALLALVLAAVGVYGMMAYSVAARTREIGVRVAFGAKPERVFAMVLRQGLTTSLIGLAIGLAGAAALGRALTRLLYGVTPLDATTFAMASLVLLAVTVVACLVPARRALRIDPLEALRAD